MTRKTGEKNQPPCLYLVSGSSGVAGSQLLNIGLAQFEKHFRVEIRRYVRSEDDVTLLVSAAAEKGAGIIHSFVRENLRNHLVRTAKQAGVVTLDLMGPLLDMLTFFSKSMPEGRPGLHRKMQDGYFDRVDAMRFSTLHDDGARSDELNTADIVLLGVSRCGKTPLSVYLSVLGWKTGNIPIVSGMPLPNAVRRLDRRRVFGLNIDFERLISHRKKRRLAGGVGIPGYTDKSTVFAELEWASNIFRENRFRVIDVTDKPIESSAEEIIEQVLDRFPKIRRP